MNYHQSQVLDYTKLYKYYEKVFELAIFCKEKLNFKMEFINFGGGLGVQYSIENEEPLEIEKLGKKCELLVREFKEKTNARLIIESGRFLVCESGQYVSLIVDKKESMGITYLFVEKGLNIFIRPGMAEMIMGYMSEEENVSSAEPYFTVKDAFEFTIPTKNKEIKEKVTIARSLFTALDILATDIVLPKADIGDMIIISKAGIYAYSLSALFFASHSLPLELYLDKKGNINLK